MHYLISFLQPGYETDTVIVTFRNLRHRDLSNLPKVFQKAGGQSLCSQLLPEAASSNLDRPAAHLPSQAEAGAVPPTPGNGWSHGQRKTPPPPDLIPLPQGCLGGLLRTRACGCNQGPIKARANPFNEQHLAAPVQSKAGWSLGGNQRGQAVDAAP